MQHFYSFVSQVCHCWFRPFLAILSDSDVSALCVTAGVRPFPLAMQHFNSFVFKVIISLLPGLSPWCPPFSAGHAAFLFICFPCGLFTLFSRFGACTAGIRPFPLSSISIHLSPR